MNRFLGNRGIEEIEIKTMRHLVATILEKYGVNFGDYALSSLKRRILVFANKEGFRSIDTLIAKIERDREFFEEFIANITVSTTEMFRDPAFWRQVRDTVLKRLSSKDQINIWIPGCATGEEIYTLAIVLHEVGLYDRCNVLATDINEKVFETAKAGIYRKRQMEINEHNFSRYEGNGDLTSFYDEKAPDVKMNSELLNNVTFKTFDLAAENTLADKFDLIICRNVLIYFNHTLHENVLELLESSIVKDGFLAIGVMERLVGRTSHNKLIRLSEDDNIFRKI